MNWKPKKIKNNRIKNPYRSNIISISSNLRFLGNNAKRIFEPSSGGIGIKLKIAKTILIKIIISIKIKNGLLIIPKNIVNFKIKLKIIAIERLLNGPANPISPLSLFGFFKFKGLNGTGFAQPNKIGLLAIKSKNGNKNEPKKSKCFKGFKVSRPAFFAVGSPSLFAIIP